MWSDWNLGDCWSPAGRQVCGTVRSSCGNTGGRWLMLKSDRRNREIREEEFPRRTWEVESGVDFLDVEDEGRKSRTANPG